MTTHQLVSHSPIVHQSLLLTYSYFFTCQLTHHSHQVISHSTTQWPFTNLFNHYHSPTHIITQPTHWSLTQSLVTHRRKCQLEYVAMLAGWGSLSRHVSSVFLKCPQPHWCLLETCYTNGNISYYQRHESIHASKMQIQTVIRGKGKIIKCIQKNKRQAHVPVFWCKRKVYSFKVSG